MTFLKRKTGFTWYITGTFLLILVFFLFRSSVTEDSTQVIKTNAFVALPPAIPENLSFCDEIVPLQYFDVRESVERELMVNVYWHSQTIGLLQKCHRFFPEIEKILKENDIPNDFKYLVVAESGLSHAVSPAGAVGFWQLLEGTAKDYGMEINKEIDERYHIGKSTEVACKYFKESYALFNSWTLAAASYNVGRRGVEKQMERQKESNYFDLLFNEETSRYVYRALAFKIIFENPEAYGFVLNENNLYKPIAYEDIKIEGPVENLADFAQLHGTNYKMLKILNPWLRESFITNKESKTYVIRVPLKDARIIR